MRLQVHTMRCDRDLQKHWQVTWGLEAGSVLLSSPAKLEVGGRPLHLRPA